MWLMIFLRHLIPATRNKVACDRSRSDGHASTPRGRDHAEGEKGLIWGAELERAVSRHQLFGRPDQRPFLGMVHVFGRSLDPQNGRDFK
jgi:hypothetical protein